MRILFLTSPVEDYLADSILHGFKCLFGPDVVDFPKCEILYRNCPEEILHQVRGRGFTLYSGLLDDEAVDRFNILYKVRAGYFALVVIANIWRQYGWFVQLRPWLRPENTIILDGGDTSQPYPAAGLWWRRPYYWLLPRAHREFLYFKREWTPATQFSLWHRLVPGKLLPVLPVPKNLRTVAFSFPEEKIVSRLPEKTKNFPVHIVDPEVAKNVQGAQTRYVFTSEAEYYSDLQRSRVGITTKRAGWDCLRHYEIAANGAVICFRDLGSKPKTCAPHGLDSNNCIIYQSSMDLIRTVTEMPSEHYDSLQSESMAWAKKQTTVVRASEVLEEHRRFVDLSHCK